MNFQAGTEGYDYYPLCRNLLRIGKLFFDAEDYDEAAVWYYNAAFETASILDVHTSGNIPLNGLADCYENPGMQPRRKNIEMQPDNGSSQTIILSPFDLNNHVRSGTMIII